MQTYIHYGLGFSGKLLSKQEFNAILNTENYPDKGEIKIQFTSFTEDIDGPHWGTVVLQDLGELPCSGKFITLVELEALMSPHRIIDLPTRAAINAELASVGLTHLADKVELVLFSVNY